MYVEFQLEYMTIFHRDSSKSKPMYVHHTGLYIHMVNIQTNINGVML